jgi:hypothetical protein
MRYLFISFLFVTNIYAQTNENNNSIPDNSLPEKVKEKVLDFSGGVIEGDLNRPSMLMELGNNYKEFNDLILLRDDFNSFHEIDSLKRFRYFDENL